MRQEEGQLPRVYEQWQGNEVFFCNGRCVAGPNWRSLFGTSFLILVPLVVYLWLVGTVLTDEIHIAIPTVALVLGVMALIFLFTTGCMDPGILKRQEPDDDFLMGRKAKTNEVVVNGHPVLVRYNETCHFYQPPRAHHCSVNDNCIQKFDHHCPWVGTTIGLRNYRFFLSFIFTASLLCIYVCATAVLAIKLEYDNLHTDDRDLKKALEEAPAAIAVSLYTALFFLFVGGLSFFHIYLVSTNQTTYENFRYGYDRNRNPYDLSCFGNCWSVWCTAIPPSDVNFREFVQPKNSGPSSTTRTSFVENDSIRSTSTKERGSRSNTELEMGSSGQGTRVRYNPSEHSSDATYWDPPHSHVSSYSGGTREASRQGHYVQRAASNIGPEMEQMEIQVIPPRNSHREEPPNNLRRQHSEGPEVRMFPGNPANSFRPTTVPNQDGVTPRPRPTTHVTNRRAY